MKSNRGAGVVTIEARRALERLDDVGARIVSSFDRDRYPSWRSTGGIARTTGLPEDTVHDYIQEHPTYFTIGPVRPAGEPLYTPARELFDTVTMEE